jgi:hypothetical protein
MNPISLQFSVDLSEDENDENENVDINSFTNEAKNLFIDTIKNQFTEQLYEVSSVKITNIKITVKNNLFILNGEIPVKLTDIVRGVSLKKWIEAINEKSIWQMRYGPTNEYEVDSNGKKYKLVSVHTV